MEKRKKRTVEDASAMVIDRLSLVLDGSDMIEYRCGLLFPWR